MQTAETMMKNEDVVDVVERVVVRLKQRLLDELTGIEDRLDSGEESPEQHLKMLTGFFKMIQGVDQMVDGIEQRQEEQREQAVDIVEFREELEAQIARLVDAENEAGLPQ